MRFPLLSAPALALGLLASVCLANLGAEEVRRAQPVQSAPVPKATTNAAATPTAAPAAKPASDTAANPATVAATSTNAPSTEGKKVELSADQRKKIETELARARTADEELARKRRLLDRNMPNAQQTNPTLTERKSIPSRF